MSQSIFKISNQISIDEVEKIYEKNFEKIIYEFMNLEIEWMFNAYKEYKDLDKYLKPYGFIRVETAWCEGTIPWGDALYLKKIDLNRFRIIKCTSINYIQNIKGYFFFKAIPKRFKKFLKSK